MNTVEVNLVNPNTQGVTRRRVKPGAKFLTMKIDGKKARVPLTPKYRHDVDGPEIGPGFRMFLLNAKNGLPCRLSESQTYEWPTAYDMVVPYIDGRSETMARATKTDGTQWAKIGAIAGAVSILVLFMLLYFVFQIYKGAQENGVVAG